jgi:uncharacterized surface protein with fasciclin (FAS1) repeats
LSFASVALASHPPATRPPTIAGIVAQSGGTFDNNLHDFDVLLTAVQAANLVGALDDRAARLTVFAPNDGAFVQTARDLGFTGQDEAGAWQFLVTAFTGLGNGDPIPVLTNVLLYHVAPGRLTTPVINFLDRVNRPIHTLLADATIQPDDGALVDNDPDFANPRIIRPRNLVAANAIIQTIDRVLLPINLPGGATQPATIADTVAQSGGQFDANTGDFDLLLTALQTANLVDALDNPASSLTVFAPTDAAFIQTARDLGFTGNDEAGAWQFLVAALTGLGNGDPVPVLTNILLYHVAPFEASPQILSIFDQIDLGVPTLLTGSTLQISGQSIVDADPDITNPNRLTTEPVDASNGLIYPIDRVLLPINL